MAIQKRTVKFFNEKKNAEKELKKYGKGHSVRKHPKWKTWDVVRTVKVKKKRQQPIFCGFRF